MSRSSWTVEFPMEVTGHCSFGGDGHHRIILQSSPNAHKYTCPDYPPMGIRYVTVDGVHMEDYPIGTEVRILVTFPDIT